MGDPFYFERKRTRAWISLLVNIADQFAGRHGFISVDTQFCAMLKHMPYQFRTRRIVILGRLRAYRRGRNLEWRRIYAASCFCGDAVRP